MSDLIDRQAAITAIQAAYADTEGGDDKCAVWKNIGLTNALHIMQDLPSVQPERWIPVSERLPDMWDERYLVSLAWGGIGVMEYKSTGFHNYGSFTPVSIESIIAWMPLPEPYKGEQE